MTSREIFDLMKSLTEKDLKILVSSIVEYLVNYHGIEFKDIIKDIENAHKFVEDKRG